MEQESNLKKLKWKHHSREGLAEIKGNLKQIEEGRKNSGCRIR